MAPQRLQSPQPKSATFWVLAAFLLLVFWTGGSARADAQSLILLRPVAILLCGYGLWRLRTAHIRQYAGLFGITAAIVVLVALHLLPLPPTVWQALPGRQLLADVDSISGAGAQWRPISIIPAATWNAAFSLSVPMAVLLLGTQLSRAECFALLPVIIGLGLMSALLGLIQIIGPPDSALYLYRITNNGAAVGLFANRNHQAALLASLFPMLAAYAWSATSDTRQRQIGKWLLPIATVVLIPLLLVTGSRAGLILGVFGLLSIVLFVPKAKPDGQAKSKLVSQPVLYALALAGVGVLALASIFLSRAEAFNRLFADRGTEQLRSNMWEPITEAAWTYFPVGSGIGTFVETYQISEPDNILTTRYINHAHNDYLEIFLTVGFPGVLLIAVAIFGGARQSLRAWRSPIGDRQSCKMAKMGTVAMAFMALASIGDYPLRTPSLMAAMVVFALWLWQNQPASRDA